MKNRYRSQIPFVTNSSNILLVQMSLFNPPSLLASFSIGFVVAINIDSKRVSQNRPLNFGKNQNNNIDSNQKVLRIITYVSALTLNKFADTTTYSFFLILTNGVNLLYYNITLYLIH